MKSLKVILWIVAVGCLAAIPFIFTPWSVVENICSKFGFEGLPNTPMTIYFFKVYSGIFGLIGVFFIMLARDPLKYGSMLKLGAFGLVLFGLLALSIGISKSLPPIVYLGDGLSGLILGIATVILSSKTNKSMKT